ncbi:methyltransferase [Pseudomonas sp. HK3]|jgi:16S rRNA (guanine1207-N2)-methyltransferase
MSLTLPSQLLLQQDLPKNALLINPPRDDLAQELDESTWHVASFSYAVQQQYQSAGYTSTDVCAPLTQEYSNVVIYLPKAKARLQYVLDYAMSALTAEGEIWFVGENKGGIKSLGKNLKDDFNSIDKMAIGKHSAIVCAQGPQRKTTFKLDDYFISHENEHGLSLQSLPGVFSQEKLDKGTQVLLKYLPRKIKGRILDFGCGTGTIASYISQSREYEELEMIDDDFLAVKSAQANIEANKIEFTEAFASDGFSQIEGRYNWIVSNPPFHQGIKTDYNVTENFLAYAKEHLKLSGKLLIVANEFLNYEVILRENFKGVTTVAKENGFKVIQCEGIMRSKT